MLLSILLAISDPIGNIIKDYNIKHEKAIKIAREAEKVAKEAKKELKTAPSSNW